MSQTYTTDQLMRRVPVIPVIVIDQLEQAVPLARALVKGGLDVLEITLRTPVAMEAMRAIMAEVEGAIVGAGYRSATRKDLPCATATARSCATACASSHAQISDISCCGNVQYSRIGEGMHPVILKPDGDVCNSPTCGYDCGNR